MRPEIREIVTVALKSVQLATKGKVKYSFTDEQLAEILGLCLADLEPRDLSMASDPNDIIAVIETAMVNRLEPYRDVP